MRTAPLSPVGAQVADLSLDDVDAERAAELKALLAEHGVLVLRDQDADDEAFVAFLRSFGELAFTAGEAHVDGFPDLNVVSNVGRKTPPRSSFHVDSTYFQRPPAYTALRAVEVPERGGATLFTDQYRALEELAPVWRERLEGRAITHVVTGVQPGSGEETAAEHPVFRPHPITGRPALYLSTALRCAAISGMSDEEAKETIAFLLWHSTREENTHRHEWARGDVVIWDNACVMHRADHSEVSGGRVMHRGMVAG